MEALDDGVDLRAQAGGEHYDLGDVVAVAKSLQRLGEVALGNGAELEDLQRHVPFVDPHDNDRHGALDLVSPGWVSLSWTA